MICPACKEPMTKARTERGYYVVWRCSRCAYTKKGKTSLGEAYKGEIVQRGHWGEDKR